MGRWGRHWFVLVLVGSRAAIGAPDPSVQLKRAEAQMKSLDFEAALPLLEQVRDSSTLPEEKRVAVLLDLGITFVNVGRTEDAKLAFAAALKRNPEIRLPASTSPKVLEVFERARVVDTPVAPVIEKPVVVAPVSPASEEKQSVTHSQRFVGLSLGLVAGALVFTGLGIGSAIASRQSATAARGSLHTTPEINSLVAHTRTYGTLGWAAYGLAAACGIGAVTTFLLGRNSPVSVSAAFSSHGALVALEMIY